MRVKLRKLSKAQERRLVEKREAAILAVDVAKLARGKAKGGRPKGYRVSAATKAKLRAAWQARKDATDRTRAQAVLVPQATVARRAAIVAQAVESYPMMPPVKNGHGMFTTVSMPLPNGASVVDGRLSIPLTRKETLSLVRELVTLL